MEVINGKLYMRTKKTRRCKKEVKLAQEIINEAKTNKIIFK